MTIRKVYAILSVGNKANKREQNKEHREGCTMGAKNEKIEKMCLYCERSTSIESEGELSVICDRKGAVPPDGHCLRFRYDPLKRRVDRMPAIPTLTEEFT